MKILLLLILVLILSGCGPWFSGGGEYTYKRHNPSTNATIEVTVESTREVRTATIHFSPDGAVDIEVEGIQPGPDNMGQALTIIDSLIKAGVAAAIP